MRLYLFPFAKEIIINSLIGIGIFTLFFFFGESSKLLELALIVSGGSWEIFARSLSFLFGKFWLSTSGFVFPMALLLGVTLAISRLQEDREIIALESLGINTTKVLVLFSLLIGSLSCLATYRLVHQTIPDARYAIKRFAYEGRDSVANLKIEPKTWLDLDSAQLFAQEVDGLSLQNVTVYSRTSKDSLDSNADEFPYKVTGSSATYEIRAVRDSKDQEQKHLILKIFSGNLEYPEHLPLGDVTICQFATYENHIPLMEQAAPEKSIREFPSQDLSSRQSKPNQSAPTTQEQQADSEMGTRQALSLSPLALCFVCSLITLRLNNRSKSFGFGMALLLLVSYWIVLVMTSSLQQAWMTNPAYVLLGLITAKALR